MLSANELIKYEELTSDIQLCYINIDLFAKNLFSSPLPDNFRVQRNILLNEKALTESILSEAEFLKINSFKTLKKQVEWLAGRYAVKKLAVKTSLSASEQDIELAYEELGAPYIKDFPETNISISHSNKYAIAGLSTKKEIKFGIDIEKFEKANFEKSMMVAFSDKEIEYLEACPYEERYLCWTAKEAYLKYIKKGFHENLKSIEILNNILYFNNQKVNLKLLMLSLDDNYALSIVYN